MTPEALPQQVLAALKAGHKIEAIKQLRIATGLGLKEAKDRIEAYERGGSPSRTVGHSPRHKPHAPGLAPGEVARSANAAKWVALIALAIAAIGAALYFH
jgi:hypothetical protein